MEQLIVEYIDLTDKECEVVQRVIADLARDGSPIPIDELLEKATIFAHELPRRLRSSFYSFKLSGSSHAICVRGNLYAPESLPPTPSRHRPAGEPEVAFPHDTMHVLFASLLGEPFGWTSIQHGYVINDVMPVEEHQNLVASSGSATNFDLHTEDAFHPCAGDYLGLMCLRNPTRAATVLSGVAISQIPAPVSSILFEPRFIVGNNVAQTVPDIGQASPILWGNRNRPYLRVNLNSTRALPGDTQAEEALEALTACLRINAVSVKFAPGDFWYIDNYRVAHGRGPFQPSYDGDDRWLRRLYISSSFRQSAAFRTTPEARILNPMAAQWRFAI